MKLLYDVKDKPKFSKVLLFAMQQILAIITATIAVPSAVGLQIHIPAAILGAGIGTLIYTLVTKGRSPIFHSSSFSFANSLVTAIAFGYLGIIIGAILASSVYLILSLIVKKTGTAWIKKIMPTAVIAPIVILIGLSLAKSQVAKLVVSNGSTSDGGYNLIALFIGLFSFFGVVICSAQNRKKSLKLVPFIIATLAGYTLALIISGIGYAADADYMKIIDFSVFRKCFYDGDTFRGFKAFFDVPKISIVEGIKELKNGEVGSTIRSLNPNAQFITATGVIEVALAFIPISFVCFAEHIADHENLSHIIGHDLLEDPGLSRTLLGDGLGSMFGTLFGICPNTTYGESIACVASTGNASSVTIVTSAVGCIIFSFLTPFNAFFQSIPECVMGGVCVALLGFIALSGLQMLKDLDFDDKKVFFTVVAILVTGVGGLVIKIPYEFKEGTNEINRAVEISSIATALILGIITYQVCNKLQKKHPVEA